MSSSRSNRPSMSRAPPPPPPPPPPPRCWPNATWISRNVASARIRYCSAFCSGGSASCHLAPFSFSDAGPIASTACLHILHEALERIARAGQAGAPSCGRPATSPGRAAWTARRPGTRRSRRRVPLAPCALQLVPGGRDDFLLALARSGSDPRRRRRRRHRRRACCDCV